MTVLAATTASHRITMRRVLATTLMLLFGTLSCKTVLPGDLTGTWTATDQSRKGWLPEFEKAAATIVVNADGSFVASELPEELHVNAKTHHRLDSGAGVWKPASWEGAQHPQLEFHDLPSVEGQARGPYGLPLTVSRAGSVVTLYYSLGDPDEPRRVTIERK